MADGCGKEASAQKNQNWSYHEAKCPVEIWVDEEIQRQLSAMCRIFGRTLPQNVIKTVTSAIKLLSLSKTRPQNSRISTLIMFRLHSVVLPDYLTSAFSRKKKQFWLYLQGIKEEVVHFLIRRFNNECGGRNLETSKEEYGIISHF